VRKLGLILAVLAGLTTPALADLKAEIEKANAQFAELLAKGDSAGIAALYTDDATALPPGSEMVKGRPAIAAFWQGQVGTLTEFKTTTVDVKRLSRAFAREVGTFSFKPKGSDQVVQGKYVVVWQKLGRDWKLAVDIWNTNK
jgi:ketosteroid isomerase-like protein